MTTGEVRTQRKTNEYSVARTTDNAGHRWESDDADPFYGSEQVSMAARKQWRNVTYHPPFSE